MNRNIFGSGFACLLLFAAVDRPLAAQPTQIPGESVLGTQGNSEVEQHRSEVAALSGLSITTADRQPEAIADPRQFAADIATGIGQVRTYGTWCAILNSSMPALAGHDFVQAAWLSDVVEPDAVHTTQTMWDGRLYVYDEWLTIKGDEYESPLPFKPRRSVREPINRGLDLRKYARVLQQGQPLSAVGYRYDGSSYVLLTYEVPMAGDLAWPFRDPGDQASTGSLKLELWVDRSAQQLVKVRAVPDVARAGAQPSELEQVFIGYGEELRIEAPPLMIEQLTTGEGFSRFVTTYYLQPQPDKVADAIRALDASGLARPPSTPDPRHSPFVNWFAEVFLANPGRLPEWRKLVDGQKGAAGELLQAAMGIAARGGVLALPVPSPSGSNNDWYWAGFFASGNPAYIHRLIDQLQYVDNRQDLNAYAAGGTAELSLSSNAQLHPRVRDILREVRSGADARTAQLIDELLQKDPALILVEVQQTIQTMQNTARKTR